MLCLKVSYIFFCYLVHLGNIDNLPCLELDNAFAKRKYVRAVLTYLCSSGSVETDQFYYEINIIQNIREQLWDKLHYSPLNSMYASAFVNYSSRK